MKKLLLLALTILFCQELKAADVGTFSGGSGTAEDPFIVTKVADLNEIHSNIYYKGITYEGYYFKMGNDIDMSSLTTANANVAIGTTHFCGIFDGCGYSFKNINLSLKTGTSYSGIFAYVGATGVLKNINIDSPVITPAGTMVYSGILCGQNNGLIENCHVINAEMNLSKPTQTNTIGGVIGYLVYSGTVRNCSFTGNVKTAAGFGGIVGTDMGGLIENCSVKADIILARSNIVVGGIASSASYNSKGPSVNFKNCVFDGSIKVISAAIASTYVGGIAAKNTGCTIDNCENRGFLMAQNYNGGIAGWLYNGANITNCCNTGVVCDIFMANDSTNVNYTGTSDLGGIAGYSNNGVIDRCYNVGSVRGFRVAGGIVGYTLTTTINDSYNAGLVDAPFVSLSGTMVIGQGGSIVGYASSGGTNLKIKNCLSLGTVNASSTVRNDIGQFVGRYNDTAVDIIDNCYYDNNISGWGIGGKYSKSTEELTSGKAIEGFDSEVWIFTEGYYPRLAAHANTDAAKAGASPIYLSPGNNQERVTSNISLGTATGAKWALNDISDAALEGNEVKITRGKTPETLLITSTVGEAVRTNLLHIYPDIFKGSGTYESPYEISNYEDLKSLANATTVENMTFEGDYFKLTADIDMESDVSFVGISQNNHAAFNGILDGNGYRLKNWVLENGKDKKSNGGLFGVIGQAGVVKNLIIDQSCKASLYTYSGILASRVFGELNNCSVLISSIDFPNASANVGGLVYMVERGGSILNCYNGADMLLPGSSNTSGGIASNNFGKISGCQYAGNLSAPSANNIGGISYYNIGQISDCLVSGSLTADYGVGGIVANNASGGGIIENSLITAQITYNKTGYQTGSVVGRNTGDIVNVYYDSQITCYNNINSTNVKGELSRNLTGKMPAGFGELWSVSSNRYPMLKAFAAYDGAIATSLPIIFKDNDTRMSMRQGSANIPDFEGAVFSINTTDSKFSINGNSLIFAGSDDFCNVAVNVSYGTFNRNINVASYGSLLSGDGTSTSPWKISTEEDLLKVAAQTAIADNYGNYAGTYFSLTNDIVLKDDFIGIGSLNRSFCGVINGNGHSISNMNIKGTASYKGLVSMLGIGGSIENLTIGSGLISNTATYTGAFVGYCSGTLINCVNKADISTTATYTGGIVGYANDANLQNVHNYGSVTCTKAHTGGIAGSLISNSIELKNVYNHGVVTGDDYIGGIVGSADKCAGIGQAYNYGVVSGDVGVGGIVGYNYPLSSSKSMLIVNGCVNSGDVSGTSNIGGIIGQDGTYPLTIINCVNTGKISNTSATVSASTPGAGGILGGGCPTEISGCVNTGEIYANNCAGGIIGRMTNATAVTTITNCLNTGWIANVGESSANIGSIAGFLSSAANLDGNVYDKQMSSYEAVTKADKEGAIGKNTNEILVNGYYPMPQNIQATEPVILGSLPLIFKEGEARYNVKSSFTVGSYTGAEWIPQTPLKINGSTIGFENSYTGSCTLGVKLGEYVREISLYANYDATSNVIETPESAIYKIANGSILFDSNYKVIIHSISGSCIFNGYTSSVKLSPGIYLVTVDGISSKAIVR